MPIQSQYTPDSFVGDGVEDTFTFTFRILAKTDLVAITRDESDVITVLELNSDYTIANSDVDAAGGGDVVLTDPLPTGTKIFLIRNTARTQLVNIEEGSPFPSAVVTKVFDRHLMMIQELYYKLRKAIKFADASEFFDINAPEPQAGALLQWNSAANGLQNTLASALGITNIVVDVAIAAGDVQAVVTHGLGSSSVRIVGFTPSWGTGFNSYSQTDDAITVDLTVECPTGGGNITFELAFS